MKSQGARLLTDQNTFVADSYERALPATLV
jgi:hypothetical protein